ncbi:hypothetical protein KC887_02890 [Candidatus Kaiserbacteria bacterium]|nr:hypothetical protein [Candidatus Kaiserbacteria bacterium]
MAANGSLASNNEDTMIFWHIGEDGKANKAITDYPTPWSAAWQSRNDLYTPEQAAKVAQELTEATGDLYIPTDSGGDYLPRYDVIRGPVVGSPVSYGFNGDYYPCGTITAVSKSLKVVTATDDNGVVRRFYRRGKTASWRMDGCWSMVHGHINRLNPHF